MIANTIVETILRRESCCDLSKQSLLEPLYRPTCLEYGDQPTPQKPKGRFTMLQDFIR